ncbi:MAG: efflux RND transporter periplasmic adaptor subunit, partial [Burkholderiales bacterium]
MTERAGFWLGFAALASLVGGGVYYYAEVAERRVAPSGYSASAQAAIAPSRSAVAVEAQSVTIGTVVEDLRAVGTLRPNEAVTVVSEIAGRVERIGFEEGSPVKAGEVLIELDASILRAELAKARSDLTLAGANHERATALATRGLATQRALDEARAALQ